MADKIKKSEFALKHAIDETDWTPPGYIIDGLKWLAAHIQPIPEDDAVHVANPEAATVPEEVGER